MKDDVIHTLSEFGSLPWDELDPKLCSRDWSFGRGGHGFGDQTWSVSILHDEGGMNIWADIWELPPQVGAMLEVVKSAERNRVRVEIRNALGIE
jgi:hypothetical protein